MQKPRRRQRNRLDWTGLDWTTSLDMNHVLMVVMLLWSSGLQAEENDSPEPNNVRLVEGGNRCAGRLEMELHGEWKPVDDFLFGWNLRTANVVCRQLDCGSAVSAKIHHSGRSRHVWKIKASSFHSRSVLRDNASLKPQYSSTSLDITCSESVRLEDGATLCSGEVAVRANQSWSLACIGDYDWQNADVVCRELGCGHPLKLHWALYVNIKLGTKEFWCRGNESTVLDCENYEPNTCLPLWIACSEPDNVRLVEGGSRCAGRLEMELHDDWKPVDGKVDLKSATVVCRHLNCGFAVSVKKKPSAANGVWGILPSTVQSVSALREHVSMRPWHSSSSLEIACSDLLFQPIISVSPSITGVSEYSNFTVRCSIKPQYPGGSFQLAFTISDRVHNYIEKAVGHTSHFLFPAAHHGHQGNYSCVYHIYVFSHNFSSESQTLFLSISASPIVFTIRLVVLLLTLTSFLSALCFNGTAATTRGQEPGIQENIELEGPN